MAFCISCIGHTPSNESTSIHNGQGKKMTESSLIFYAKSYKLSQRIRKLLDKFQFGRLSVVPGSKFKHRTSHVSQSKHAICVKHVSIKVT
jgi:hypothetical protein